MQIRSIKLGLRFCLALSLLSTTAWVLPLTTMGQKLGMDLPIAIAQSAIEAQLLEAAELLYYSEQAASVGRFQEALAALSAALEIIRDPAVRAAYPIATLEEEWTVLNDAGLILIEIGEYEQAAELFQQSLVIARELGDREGEGIALGHLGIAAEQLGNYAQAIDYYQQHLASARALGLQRGESNALGNLGNVYTKLEQYEQGIDFLAQQLAITREIGDRAGEGRALTNLGNAAWELGDYPQSVERHQQSLAIFQELGDPLGIATVSRNLGSAYLSSGQFAEGIAMLQRSLQGAQEIGYFPGEFNVLGLLGDAYLDRDEYDQATDFYQQQLTVSRIAGDPASEARALRNFGKLHRLTGDYPQAINTSLQALVMAQQIGDRAIELQALSELTWLYGQVDQRSKAFETGQSALMLAREIDDRNQESIVLGRLGNLYETQGQYQQAIEHYEQSLIIANEMGNQIVEGDRLNNLGSIYLNVGQYSQAITLHQLALTIAQEIDDQTMAVNALTSLGNNYFSVGQYETAVTYHQQSLERARQSGLRTLEDDILGNLGSTYQRLGQQPQAIAHFEESATIAREGGDRMTEMNALNNLGSIYGDLGQSSQAHALMEQSLAIAREIGDRAGESRALNNLGAALFFDGDFAQAEAYLFSAVEILESLRLGGLPEPQRLALTDTQRGTYQVLQATLIEQNKAEAALEIAERGRARVFLEELESRLNPESVARLEGLEPPNIAQIKQIAQAQNATLVQYSTLINDRIKQLYIWVVQPTGEIEFQSVDLQGRDLDLSNLVNDARFSMGVLRSIVDWGETTRVATSEGTTINQRLQQLHQLLIEPIAPYLPNDPGQTVIFIPQGELFLVPFAALQSADGKYLIDDHTILTAPSIQILASTRTQQAQVRQANLQTPLIVGNPTIPELSLASSSESLFLAELPGAEQEAIEIANALNTEPLLGKAATKSTVVEQMANARIIHLATHGILNELEGLSSGIVLAADGTGELNDGLLTAAEIAELELNAELVVLSACNTGQGRITGDGVVGLSRSLILAGVPTVVVSLWAVPDQPTGALMVEFYRQLEQTDNKAQALRQAMLAVREQYPDPIAWAAFTLIGEAE